MKRRVFFAQTAGWAAGVASLAPLAATAQAATPQANIDYVKLGQQAPVEAPAGKVEVIEFFWYSCPHCSAFEPVLSQWVKKLPADVVFKRVPIAFQNSYVAQQQLFYALEDMGLLDTLHSRVFAAIHGERQNLVKPEAIAEWVGRQGVDKAKFLSHFNSFSTVTKASRARQLMTAYAVEGVPAMGVAGRFYTDGSLAKSMDRALAVADYLIAEARAKR